MASAFGWLDTDASQRRTMLEIVDLFRESGTVDDLGIGTVRDAFSDLLFPGTSTLHTRLRYIMFVPWLMKRAAAHGSSADDMTRRLRDDEFHLIESLIKGGEFEGVFGNRARRQLRRLPSTVYWGALRRWGIVTADSPTVYFDNSLSYAALARRSAPADDPESRPAIPPLGIDENVPQEPQDLLRSVTFELTAKDEDYISSRIVASTSGSLLAWLVRNEPREIPTNVWELDNLTEAPRSLQNDVQHARRFSVIIHGAAILYNLLVARKAKNDELCDTYDDAMEQWRAEAEASRVLDDWDGPGFWTTVLRQNPRIRTPTREFVDNWVALAQSGESLRESRKAHAFIQTRERRLKGPRARFANQAVLDQWGGSSGMGRLVFRWPSVSQHLQDLYEARRRA